MSRRFERFVVWIAWRLPRAIVYWCVIRAGVHATTGRWAATEVPATTLPDILKRWEHDNR